MSSKHDSAIDTVPSDSLNGVSGGAYNPRAFYNNRFNWARPGFGNWNRNNFNFRNWELRNGHFDWHHRFHVGPAIF